MSKAVNGMKECSHCKKVYPVNEGFWRDASHSDGLSSRCKDCTRESARAIYTTNKMRMRQIVDAKKIKVRVATRHEVRMGRLKKEPCYLCNETPVDAHHLNYDYPLKVVWLCRRHHAGVHNA